MPWIAFFEYDKSEEPCLMFHLLQFNSKAKQGEKLFQTIQNRFLRALQSFIHCILSLYLNDLYLENI